VRQRERELQQLIDKQKENEKKQKLAQETAQARVKASKHEYFKKKPTKQFKGEKHQSS